jgi:CDP-diacylglycerol--glycerol-3-phosphate 3-phosphatidyltransferase
MKREFFTVSNLLSVIRALLSVPFAYVMLLVHPPLRFWGAGIVILAALTDKLDGVLARRLKQETEWGRILDPVADKVGVAVFALVLLRLGDLPLWFVAALILRDLLILVGGLYIRLSRRVVLPSNQFGKWTVGVVALALFAALLGASVWLKSILLAASLAGLIVSLVAYVARFVEVMAQPAR